MPRIAGIVVSSTEVDLVVLEENAGHFALKSSLALKTQIGERAKAYHIIYEQLAALLREQGVDCACVKASIVVFAGMNKSHLEAAELRGVVQASAASVCDTRTVEKADMSRTLGSRKAEEYLKDDATWKGLGLEQLKKGMREPALTVISQFS